MSEEKRDCSIDVARGIGILFVVMGICCRVSIYLNHLLVF